MQQILDCFFSIAPKIQELICTGEMSYTLHQNASGDTQLALDVQSDLLIEQELSQIPSICALFSEEQEEIRYLCNEGRYCVSYDPIDGSSLLSSNLSVGTIFGIYSQTFEAKNLLIGGYILYGPRLELIFATKGEKGARHYRFDPITRQWKKEEDLLLESKGKINATGGTQKYWPTWHKQIINELFLEGYRLRYSGGMVPDLHQILIKKGGLFSYPSTQDAPHGKLRKLFEVFPFALIFECAGGEATDGENRLLDLKVADSHESCPCFFGSLEEIKKVKEAHARK